MELRIDHSLELPAAPNIRETVGFAIRIPFDISWRNRDLPLWQVCGGEAHKIDRETAFIISDESRRLSGGPAFKKGIWQQVWLDGQWWPLKLDKRHAVKGMSCGGVVQGFPKARRRRPVLYMRYCEWEGSVVFYWSKTQVVASIRLEDGGGVRYICPVSGEPVALCGETIRLCLHFL